jgi:solute carrier family 25 carnitine/acylcarnitine transporter 20/29
VRLAAEVVKEEGVGGLWRGFPLPLITISIVRTISFTIYTSTKRMINSVPGQPSELKESPWLDIRLGMLNRDRASDVAVTSALAGAASGAVVCVGSAPFELVKVGRESGDNWSTRSIATRTPNRLAPSPLDTRRLSRPRRSRPCEPSSTRPVPWGCTRAGDCILCETHLVQRCISQSTT